MVADSATSTVANILKKQVCVEKLENREGPERQKSTSLVDDLKSICMVKKTHFMTAKKVKNTLQDVGVAASLSTIKNKKARLQFAKTHNKENVCVVD